MSGGFDDSGKTLDEAIAEQDAWRAALENGTYFAEKSGRKLISAEGIEAAIREAQKGFRRL